MALEDLLIPIASILVPIGTLFVVRSLDKGEKRRSKLDIDLKEIQNFIDTNKSLIARLVERIDIFDERLRRAENDLNRVLGKLNGK